MFAAGRNETQRGDFIFDALAASAVMAAYRKRGTRVMIDLEHLALDTESPHFDPDARGWCDLEVREGELWAVNVTWTADGATRIKDRRQIYVSPAFLTDKDRRVVEIHNVAICAMPATHAPQQLIAASAAFNRLKLHTLQLITLSLLATARINGRRKNQSRT